MTITQSKINKDLLKKYSVSIPRYTSYPTAPEWNENFKEEDFKKVTDKGNLLKSSLSLYFHLPFCENQCYFCACNVVISKKKDVVEPYLRRLKEEIKRVSSLISKERKVEQIHFGGGTPTFFSPEELHDLFKAIENEFNLSDTCEIGVEVDPRVTKHEHLEMLSLLGFNRLSMGIQDFELNVQESINRVQPFIETKEMFGYAEEFGFMSINTDLVYGLPHQTLESFKSTVDLILDLNPDRIALFHYAHLPQMLPHQAKYIPEKYLPESDVKIDIFQYAVDAFSDSGYVFIGLDHFAKAGDELAVARKNNSLHRNFQGYTTKAGCDLYGFGITGISNIQNSYSQNIKKLNPYYDAIDSEKLPLFRGMLLSADDEIRKEIIMRILCRGEIVISEIENIFNLDFYKYFAYELTRLKELEIEGLVEISKDAIKITQAGQFFLRNIACVFDYYLNNNGKKKIYSKSV